MNTKIKQLFFFLNLTFLVILCLTFMIKDISLFEKRDVMDKRILIFFSIANFICSILLLTTSFTKKLIGPQLKWFNRMILVFCVCAAIQLIFRPDLMRLDRFFFYYLLSIIAFGVSSILSILFLKNHHLLEDKVSRDNTSNI